MENPGKEAVSYQLNGSPPSSGAELKVYDEDVYTASPSTHPLSCVLSIMMPCAWLCACYTVEEQEQAIVLQVECVVVFFQHYFSCCNNLVGQVGWSCNDTWNSL
jgi:hypothetical protein